MMQKMSYAMDISSMAVVDFLSSLACCYTFLILDVQHCGLNHAIVEYDLKSEGLSLKFSVVVVTCQ